MGYNMKIYGVKYLENNDIYLKQLVSWRNHYLLDMYISQCLIDGNDTEGLYISIDGEILVDDLKKDCLKAIDFLENNVTAHRLHISDNTELIGEWEYKWDKEIPNNPFFKYDFQFHLGRYGVDGFIYHLQLIVDFINEYGGEFEEFMYEVI